ncbi:hypothetical protein Hypma_001999 [Hypsizygus marmoreus]|uniref:F-box domain-containing protein n=1 Tax=Hypsizygus marmoreus TaxID=39966 RepID=A0A369JD45_HYPMA|nr:hypothetical protein Hypma_001999 [Hypsizygus marmoreus]
MPDLGPGLPQELLDHIIDDLRDDFATLKACSLAFRSLITRSQIHLFATICISSIERCRCFRSVLNLNPTLSHHVRDLEIIYLSSWVEGDTDLPYILQRATALRSFCVDSPIEPLIWWTIPKATVNALNCAFCLPTLVRLRLSSIEGFRAPFFGLDTNLQHLFLNDVLLAKTELEHDLRSIDLSKMTASTTEIVLKSTTITHISLYSALISQPRSVFSRSRKLIIHNSGITLLLAASLTNAAMQLVETIELKERPTASVAPSSWFLYDFTTLPRLQCLELHFTLGFIHEYYQFGIESSAAMRKILDFLTSNPSALRIRRFNMRFTPFRFFNSPTPSWKDMVEELECAIRKKCRTLDEILATRAPSLLVGIELGLPISGWRHPFFLGPVDEWYRDLEVKRDVWRKMIYGLMPLTSQAGGLTTDVIPDVEI